jgi:glycosyltransferase involved in cell wall biosynthesis
MKIAFLGTRGIPARYGGFETAIEEIAPRLAAAGHVVTVYCRGNRDAGPVYKGVRRVALPAVRHRAVETLSHTLFSSVHAARDRPDAAVVFNCANAPLLPILKAARIPVAVHVDGLEWQRGKWGRVGRRYYRVAEGLAARLADELIADAAAIGEYLDRTYGRRSRFIAYGSQEVRANPDSLHELGLVTRSFHLAVARLEPENHVDVILRGYRTSRAKHPLVLVGGNPYKTKYGDAVASLAADPRIIALGSVWDQCVLDQLYANCASYIHGHSVGGTNPSLLRAMGAGAPVTAFDVVFNREVTGGAAKFFRSPQDLADALETDEHDPEAARERGERLRDDALARYSWEEVAAAYGDLCSDLKAIA